MGSNGAAVTRKDIRKHVARPVAREDIETMFRRAMEVLNWKNSRTTRYHVITSPIMLQAVKQEGLAPFSAENTKNAPVFIVTSFIKDVVGFDKDGISSSEFGDLWDAYGLGLHNENLLLKAGDLGLDTPVMGVRSAKTVQRFLNIPETEIIVSVVSTGYKTMGPEKPKRRKLDDIVTYYGTQKKLLLFSNRKRSGFFVPALTILVLVVVALVPVVSLGVAPVVVIEVIFEILRRMSFVVSILMTPLLSFNVST